MPHRIRKPQSAIALLAVLQNDTDFSVRCRAARAIGEIGDVSCAAELLNILRRSPAGEYYLQVEIGGILAKWRYSPAIPVLIDHIVNSTTVNYLELSGALSEFGSEAVPLLIDALKKNKFTFRWVIIDTLHSITNAGRWQRYEDWRIYWSAHEAESRVYPLLRACEKTLAVKAQDQLSAMRVNIRDEVDLIEEIAFSDPRKGFLAKLRRLFPSDEDEGLSFAFCRESHYRSAALLVLSRFPTVSIPHVLRHVPRPHGGRIWKAMADIRTCLPDLGVDLLLGERARRTYAGLAAFANQNGSFIPSTATQVEAAASAWVTLLLTQDDFKEAQKLLHLTVLSCSIGPEIISMFRMQEPEIAQALLPAP